MVLPSGQHKKLKILFITKWYPNRYDPQFGVYIRKHASAIASFSEVAVLHVCSDDQLKEKKYELTRDDQYNLFTVLIYFKKFSSSIPIAGKIVNFYRYSRATISGLNYIRKNFGDHDITHSYILLRPAFVAWLIQLTRKKPFVISEQWSGFATGKYAKKNPLAKWLTRFIVSKANARTVVSGFLKEHMIRNGLKNEYAVVPNIVELPSLRIRSHDNTKINILTVADLVDEIKNISGTLRAMAEIIPANRNVELHIIGEGTDRQKLELLASEMNLLNQSVFFHGLKSNDEVYESLLNCDFLVMNSNFETFSLICAEAISCGKPVIATRCGGPQEFITAETGILIEPRNQQQLVHAIQQMLIAYRNYSPENLKRYATRNFSSEIAAEKFQEVYRTIIDTQ